MNIVNIISVIKYKFRLYCYLVELYGQSVSTFISEIFEEISTGPR